MKKEIFRVGVYIEDEFNEFATCTNIQSAKKAKELLEEAGWGEDDEYDDEYEDDECEDNELEYEEEYNPHSGVIILKSNLYLDTITIDNVEYDLNEGEQ